MVLVHFKDPKFNNAVALLTWENITPENLVLARSIARQFASIIAVCQQEYLSQFEQGYGNYGMLV